VISAWVTELIGIHALFGAFALGAILPSGSKLVKHVIEKVEDFATLFLVPLYFAYTGLQTELGLLNTWQAWAIAGVVTFIATAGKVGGTYVACRGSLGNRQGLTLGVLMNTRGLMELIILNMALEVKAIDGSVYAMFVIMTLVTTAATSPVVAWLSRGSAPEKGPN
jgi:Kef-type K+ transport system membrane component KefB